MIYHFRIKAENSLWINFYGSDQYFYFGTITCPSWTTTKANNITATSAIVGGNIIDDGGSAIVERGVTWWQSSNTTGKGHGWLKDDSIGSGRFTCKLSGLKPNTSYFVHAYAKNCYSNLAEGVSKCYNGSITKFTTSHIAIWSC